jgi:hypothetical protein|tara:strand:+ start:1229 stop:1432 length:204 start_codon:yes stop_codon:yes gene_type:complete
MFRIFVWATTPNEKLSIMTQLQSTKNLNSLKLKAIKNGGYAKHRNIILLACEAHKAAFGVDLTPKNF